MEPTNEQLAEMHEQYKNDIAELDDKLIEVMTLDELTSHIFSLEEDINSNVYDEHHSVDINDPDALVEDIESVFSAVLEISMREIYSRKIYPDFDKDSMKSIVDHKKMELKEFEDGTRDFGEVGNRIFKNRLKEEIEQRS